MRKRIALFFVVALVSVFGAAACGGEEEAGQEELEQRVEQLEQEVEQQEEEIQSIKVSEQELQDGDEEMFEEAPQNGTGGQ